jgi:hypothetical protein
LKPWQQAQVVKAMMHHSPDQLGLPYVLWSRPAVQALIERRTGKRLCQHRFNFSGFHRFRFAGFSALSEVNDPEFQPVLHPVGVPFQAHHMRVVQQTVQGGGGRRIVGQELPPLAKGLVGGDHHRAVFVAGGHQLEKQGGLLGGEGLVADLIE